MKSGKYWGTYASFRMCVNNGCVTLPRQIACVESAAVCGVPLTMRDQWYEYLESGAGLVEGRCGLWGNRGLWGEAIMRGRSPTFSDITELGSQVKLVCDVAADVGQVVIVTGWDSNGNTVRTMQGGVWANGEAITLAQGAGTISTTVFARIQDILFPQAMNGQSWLYEHSTSGDRLIGQYEYNNTRPSFARYQFPSLTPQTCTGPACSGQCVTNGQAQPQLTIPCDYPTNFRLDIMGKLEHTPVSLDNDYLILGNLNAMLVMMQGVQKSIEEPNAIVKNQILGAAQQAATMLLDQELTHYRGDNITTGINISGSSIGYAEPVLNFV